MTRWSRKRSCASEIRGSTAARAGSVIACDPGSEVCPESVLVCGPVCAAATGRPTKRRAPSIERRRRLDETFTISRRLGVVRDQVGIGVRQSIVTRPPEKVIASLVACVAGRKRGRKPTRGAPTTRGGRGRLAHAQTPFTAEVSTCGVSQDASQSHVVEVAAQTERTTLGIGQERMYGPTPAHDATKE